MKYPEYVQNDLGELAEYLLARPEKDELDGKGCLSKETCKQIDRMILEDLQDRVQGYQLPLKPPRGTDPNNRWRTVSSMQKAIRFGNVDAAMFAASAAYDMDKAYLLRRLGVTAVEDVGAGSPYGMLAVLAVGSSHTWRQVMDERRLMCFLATMLAKANKDRSLCNLLCAVDFDRGLDKQSLAKLSNERLISFIEDTSDPMELRMCAAWLMAGTKRYGGETMPQDNDRQATHMFSYMVEQGLSRMSLYLAAKTASRIGESMWVSFLFFDKWLRRTKEMKTIETVLPDTPLVGKLLGAGYDMHTREGRTAISKFKKENPELLKPFFDAVPANMRDTLLQFGVFIAEGGELRSRVAFTNSERLMARARKVELNYPGLPDELHDPFIQTLKDNVSKLNECRAKVLYAKSMN